MPVAVEGGQSLEDKSRCVRLLSILFPLVCLIVLLVGYAALGAMLFKYIEGHGSGTESLDPEYNDFLLSLAKTVRNFSANDSSPVQEELRKKMGEFKTIWLQSPDQWTFFGSMFFCCTVFTTVGYGNIYPVTVTGKIVCILYAMVGIPLMLLVLTDVGDILAILVSKAYVRLHQVCHLPSICPKFPWGRPKKPMHNTAYTFSQDGVVMVPMDIKQVLRSQAMVKRKSAKLRNAKIFERIIAQENMARENLAWENREKQRIMGTLARSCSCPDLNRAQPQRGLWDLCTGEELEKLDVPLLLILALFFAYLLFGGLILHQWEKDIDIFDAFYFSFITITTIGFGDIVPHHPNFFMLISLFIITGMAFLSMAFKLGQSRFVNCYHRCIRCISGGKVQQYK